MAIIINGVTYSGSNINIQNGKISIDGKKIEVEEKIITINVDGNVDIIQADVLENLNIQGDVGSVTTQTGDVDIKGNVSGDVSTQTGDVSCKSISGGVRTQTGDIYTR